MKLKSDKYLWGSLLWRAQWVAAGCLAVVWLFPAGTVAGQTALRGGAKPEQRGRDSRTKTAEALELEQLIRGAIPLRAGGDKGIAFVARDIEGAPQAAHRGDGYQQQSDQEKDVTDEQDPFPVAFGEYDGEGDQGGKGPGEDDTFSLEEWSGAHGKGLLMGWP